uniref:Uncharacterized protein n=1 Tax=Podoviridae sp. ctlpi2 TaxID=2826574 RepID=A0A8S5MLS1_9CAUD|nr:MAG TPA: hypothetical protein [Podoviridae sp. ctlpi2]
MGVKHRGLAGRMFHGFLGGDFAGATVYLPSAPVALVVHWGGRRHPSPAAALNTCGRVGGDGYRLGLVAVRLSVETRRKRCR